MSTEVSLNEDRLKRAVCFLCDGSDWTWELVERDLKYGRKKFESGNLRMDAFVPKIRLRIKVHCKSCGTTYDVQTPHL